MLIIDDHIHIWPYYGEEIEWDYESYAQHMKYLQRHLFTWRRPARRLEDDQVVTNAWEALWDVNSPASWEARRDVNFRFERGKYLWEKEGESYYWPAPDPCPPELMIFLMDYVGVDRAVLQHTTNTFKLNKYYSRAVRKYPERFIGLAQIDASEAYTRQQEVIEELDTAIRLLGLKGLFWCSDAPQGWEGYEDFHTDKYDLFWEKADSLDIPVYTSFDLWNYPTSKVIKWIERFPNIPRVLVHGFAPGVYQKDKDAIRLPHEVVNVVETHDVYLEILPGLVDPYTGPQTGQVVRYLYDTFGASKLVWGSEGGGRPRGVSEYGKIVNYFEQECDFMSKDDLRLILGGNIRKLFKI